MHRTLICLAILLCALPLAAQRKTENVILVTTDGLRWQDLFRGMDPILESRKDASMDKADDIRNRFDGAGPEERRRKLMPFVWETIAKEGVLLGNRDKGSKVSLRNKRLFSYPGYAELMTGRPQDDVITSNDLRPSPAKTVLEVVKDELNLKKKEVALFGSWHVFRGIGASRSDSVVLNAGRQAFDFPGSSERLEELGQAQFAALTPWGETRHDYLTFEIALEYMRLNQPRMLYIAFDETDDWAHANRYDRTLQMANYVDSALVKLWRFVESDSFYRGKTTLIVGTDHGRGSKPGDWDGHGEKIPEAEAIWIAAIGPDTMARGEAANTSSFTQSDIAPTILELLGIAPAKLGEGIGQPIPLITGR